MGKPLKKAVAHSTGVAETQALPKGIEDLMSDEDRNAAIPDKSFSDEYISRTFHKMTDMELFDYAFEQKYNVLIEGPTGLGKTHAVMAYAALKEMPFYSVSSNAGIEPSQLFGKYIPDGSGSFEWVDGPVTEIVRHGGILLINEVNFVPERISTVLFGLLDKRRQIELLDHKAEKIDAHEDLMVFADMNPDYEGTRPLNKAFRNRFAIQLAWDYDTEIEKNLVASETLLALASQIRNDHAKGVYSTPLSTNMLMEFTDIMFDTKNLDLAVMNLVNHFPSDEREPIKMVVDTHRAELEEFLLRGSRYPETNQIWQDRLNPVDGYEDPEWGVFGKDWLMEDED